MARGAAVVWNEDAGVWGEAALIALQAATRGAGWGASAQPCRGGMMRGCRRSEVAAKGRFGGGLDGSERKARTARRPGVKRNGTATAATTWC